MSGACDKGTRGGTVRQNFYRAKIVPPGTLFRNQNFTGRYNFGCENCNGLAKRVPGSEKGPLNRLEDSI